LEEVQSQDALERLFEDEQNRAAIADTGYRKPLRLWDKSQIASTLKASVLLRVIAEVDDFCEGLRECGVMDSILRYPDLMASCFTASAAATPIDRSK
jgi:hypothetical protein